MKIVGCDLHTRYQQVAMLDQETGELVERRLEHASGEAKQFYGGLAGPVRVGIEATGHTRWFERMLAELGHELWVGDAARIRASAVRKQKTDARDAALLLDLLLSGRFPQLWRPSTAERELRQLLWHRQKLVWMHNAVIVVALWSRLFPALRRVDELTQKSPAITAEQDLTETESG